MAICGAAVTVLVVALVAGCEGADDAVVTGEPLAYASVSTLDASTKIPSSEGIAEIAGNHYEFAVACHELGAGDVAVIGMGDDPETREPVELYLQAFVADPYVGLRFGDGSLVEPALDSPLVLYVQNDTIRASAIRFVRDLNLETGEAEDLGFGEFEIHCYNYLREPPT